MIIAGNFKANLTRKMVDEYLKTLSLLTSEKCYIFPPATALSSNNTSSAIIGIQNAYPAMHGAFTGEVCIDQLAEFDIKTILIGHSERRHVLLESQEFIAQKFAFFANLGFEIFYCVGEPLEIRQKGFEAVCEYMDAQFVGIDLEYANLVIAYEPVWAIGTGMTAKCEDIAETHAWLRGKTKAPLLYGGSVNGANAKEILSTSNVDGALIGGYSLKPDDFANVVNLSN
jgi:triosephosphate isomerase